MEHGRDRGVPASRGEVVRYVRRDGGLVGVGRDDVGTMVTDPKKTPCPVFQICVMDNARRRRKIFFVIYNSSVL